MKQKTEDLLKCDILLLFAENFLDNFSRFLEFSILFFLQLDIVLSLKVVHCHRYGHHWHQMRPRPSHSFLYQEVHKNCADVEGGSGCPEKLMCQILHYARVWHVHLFMLEVFKLSFLFQDKFKLEHGRGIFDKSLVHLSGIDDLVNVNLIIGFLLTSFKLV